MMPPAPTINGRKIVDLEGFAERYADDPAAVPKLAKELGVSAVTIYKRMDDAGIKRRTAAEIPHEKHPGQRHEFTARDDEYLRRTWPDAAMTVKMICANIPCHHSVAKARARHLGLVRPARRKDAHYATQGPKIRTSDAAPVPVRFANVIHWLKKAGFKIESDIKPGLWLLGGEKDRPIPARAVVAWANDKRTRHKPKALPLFECNYDGLKGI